MTPAGERAVRARSGDAGFSYIELIVASALLMGSLLALAAMFVAGYSQVDTAGNTTMGLAAARQILEDVRRLPYDNLVNLNGFDTEDPQSLPAGEPERAVARRWRYAVAGEGVGWTFTSDEIASWPRLSDQGDALNGAGTLQAVQLTGTVTEITVTLRVPGSWRPIVVATRIARL